MRRKTGQASPEAIRKKRLALVSVFSTAVIVMILLTLADLVDDIRTEASAYEIRYENDSTFPQAGRTYTLYVDGEFYGDIDQNRFCLVDESGSTDYKYCTLMEDASQLTYVTILCVMLYLVLLIARDSLEGTPFTRKNIGRVKAIALLQLLLAVMPGLVRSVMSQVRFGYSASTLNREWIYMVIVAFVIGNIAFIFERGLDLQEDVDSIV